jgi:hypothetical protein
MRTAAQIKTLEVVFKLLRALAHRVRGDLSVLNNDLAYLATVMGESEVGRSRVRLSQIAGMMGEIGALNEGAGSKNLSALDGLSPIISGSQKLVGGELLDGLYIAVQLDQLLLVGRILNELFGVWNIAELSLRDRELLRVALVPRLSFSDKLAQGERFGSITEFIEANYGERLVVRGGIADLILLAHGWQVLIGDGQVTVCVPVNSRLG